MNLENLFAELKAQGVQIYGSKLWNQTKTYGSATVTFDGDRAVIESGEGKVYAHKTKDAVIPADGVVELYVAVAERDYAGVHEGHTFSIEKGQARLFWR